LILSLFITQDLIKSKINGINSDRSQDGNCLYKFDVLLIYYKNEQDLSPRSSTKVRQLEVLNSKRFRLIVIAVRLTLSLIAGVTVPYLIPFIVKITEVFFSMGRSYPE